MSYFFAILFSGMTWLTMGFVLMSKGLHYLVDAAEIPVINAFSLIEPLTSFAGSREVAAVWLIAISLAIGWGKGRFVLAKSATRVVDRILEHTAPVNLLKVYGLKYLLLIGTMMALGMGLRFLGTPQEVLGCIDVAIGCALVQGAVVYFQRAVRLKKA